MKKVVLIFVFSLTAILSLFLTEIIVYGGGMDYGEEYYKELKEGEILLVRKDNSIRITNYDKIASTGIRYTTLGYGVKKQRMKLL